MFFTVRVKGFLSGLVRGASEGAGLGNQFLGNIRQVSVILHLLRCFDDNENNMITHVDGSVDPVRDLETIETEVSGRPCNIPSPRFAFRCFHSF